MKLVVERVPLFVLTLTMMHVIDASSPLHGLDAEALARTIRLIIVSISGHDTIHGHQVSARGVLFSNAIHVDHHYVDISGATEDGRLIIDFGEFHAIESDEALTGDEDGPTQP